MPAPEWRRTPQRRCFEIAGDFNRMRDYSGFLPNNPDSHKVYYGKFVCGLVSATAHIHRRS
jgi:hypothetical protein